MEVSIEVGADKAPCAAGFWRRLIAFVVDALVLGILGGLAGWALFDLFAQMGGYGRLLGFVVALTYFGVMNSAMFGGQTLGKRLLGLRVVGKSGSLLPLPQSLLRYSVLGAPFFLNGAPFDAVVLSSPVIYVLSLLIFGGMFSILYLYVFNRRGRRSLHDLAVGSSVVTALTPIGSASPLPVWRVHLVVVGLLFLIATVAPAFTARLAQIEYFNDLLGTYEAINAEPGVQHAQLSHSTQLISNGRNVESVAAQVVLAEQRIDDRAFAQRIAEVILINDRKASVVSAIHVTLVYGYDIGVSSSWRSTSYQFEPGTLFDNGRSAALESSD